MTETKSPSPKNAASDAIVSELKNVGNILRDKTPQNYPNQLDDQQLEFSEFTQRALNELQQLHRSLKANREAKQPTSPDVDANNQTSSPPKPARLPVPRSISSRKPNKPKIRRGVKEIQTSLFDEPLVETQAEPSPAKTIAVDQLIDDLIAEHLPKIEQKLRAELKRLLDEQ